MPTDTPAGTAVVDIERALGCLVVMIEVNTALAKGLADTDKRADEQEDKWSLVDGRNTHIYEGTLPNSK